MYIHVLTLVSKGRARMLRLGAAVKALVVGLVYMRTGELAAQQQVAFFFMLCMTTAIDGLKPFFLIYFLI